MLHQYARLALRDIKSSETGEQDFMLDSNSSRLFARNYAHRAVLSVVAITVRVITPLRGNVREVSRYFLCFFFNNPEINIVVGIVKIIVSK